MEAIRGDGTRIWITKRSEAVRDSNGVVVGLRGTVQDITESKQEEHRMRRYDNILEGINRIFSNVVQVETEEDLGNVCLSVALEVTGGGIGFVNLVGTDGLLHDIAISEGGWDQCLMYDKAGHRRSPGNFVMNGIYDLVVNSGKAFFTNDPQSHPDSIGLPNGHPPLTSFLGVPLVLDGKTMGMIAVANREGGYTCEQQEDHEAIAPVVMQALCRGKERKNLYVRRMRSFRCNPRNCMFSPKRSRCSPRSYRYPTKSYRLSSRNSRKLMKHSSRVKNVSAPWLKILLT
jgi:transcriptional regulator with GAF, ATPase, and Fis domain